MLAVGIGAIILGYAFAYSGISNMNTGGHGWGFFQSLVNRGGNSSTSAMASFVSGIQPQGNSGATPASNDSPVKGATQI